MTVVDITARLPQPTAEQIATLDPDVDFEAAYAAGVTFAHRRAHIETFACPRARCRARVGRSCTTPNGWLASGGFHRERVDLAYNRTPAKRSKHRLSEAQAEAIEIAAHAGAYFAPGQSANFRGDAAARCEAFNAARPVGAVVTWRPHLPGSTASPVVSLCVCLRGWRTGSRRCGWTAIRGASIWTRSRRRTVDDHAADR